MSEEACVYSPLTRKKYGLTGNCKHSQTSHVCAQLCPTLCNPTGCSPPGSSLYRMFQTWILEWGAISFSRGSSWSRDWTHISCIDRQDISLFSLHSVSLFESVLAPFSPHIFPHPFFFYSSAHSMWPELGKLLFLGLFWKAMRNQSWWQLRAFPGIWVKLFRFYGMESGI